VLKPFSVDEPVQGRCTLYVNAREWFLIRIVQPRKITHDLDTHANSRLVPLHLGLPSLA
jgi:hypothetical protein